jgi:hypothetical protein
MNDAMNLKSILGCEFVPQINSFLIAKKYYMPIRGQKFEFVCPEKQIIDSKIYLLICFERSQIGK